MWEFNEYVKAYEEKIKNKEKDIIKLAYYTAGFNRAKKNKSLNHYIKEIDNSNNEKKKRNNDKLEFAKNMFDKINNSSTNFDKE